MSTALALIVGLGNPGPEYARTRHNAGADFVLALALSCAATLKPEARFHGLTARVHIAGQEVRLLIPQTWMNRSGQAVGAMAGFFKLEVGQILLAYDELDLPPGEIRFKLGGGHGGHNGVRDVISALANNRAGGAPAADSGDLVIAEHRLRGGLASRSASSSATSVCGCRASTSAR